MWYRVRGAARDQGSDVTPDRGQGRVEGVTRAGCGGIVAVARDIRAGDRRTADRVDVCLGGFRVDAVSARFPGQQPGQRTARGWGGVVVVSVPSSATPTFPEFHPAACAAVTPRPVASSPVGFAPA